MVNVDYNKKGFDKLDIDNGLAKLAEKIPVKMSDYEEIDEGMVNKVLRLEAEDGTYVLKISPLWHNDSLIREQWCLGEIASQTSAHVPSVVHYEPAESTVFGRHESLLMEHIDGGTLAGQDFEDRQLNERVSRIYTNIHKIPVRNYGWLDENFEGQENSWESFLTNIHNIEYTLSNGPFSTDEHEWLIGELRRVADDVDPVLLHGDFKPDSFIRNDDEVVPIDFQNCFSGDPDYDLGIGIYNIDRLYDYLDIYLEANDHALPQTIHQRKEKILCYAMRRGFSVLGRYVIEQDTNRIRETEQRYYALKERYLELRQE